MVRPYMDPRVEQGRKGLCLGVNRCLVRALVAIARQTGECQVLCYCLSTVLASYQMIDLMLFRYVILVDQSELAPTLGALDDQAPQLRTDDGGHGGLSREA